jgi:hypothetical protein
MNSIYTTADKLLQEFFGDENRPHKGMFLAEINGSSMQGFQVIGVVNAASTVHIQLRTTTGSLKVSITVDHETPIKVDVRRNMQESSDTSDTGAADRMRIL